MKNSQLHRSVSALERDLKIRLSTMRLQAAMGREQAALQMARSPTERSAKSDRSVSLNAILVLCGRMDLGLSQVEGSLNDLAAVVAGRVVSDVETFDRWATAVESAVESAKLLLGQVEREGLERWKNCAPGTEHAWLQCHAHFDLLRVHLSEAAEIVAAGLEDGRRIMLDRSQRARQFSVRRHAFTAWLNKSIQMLFS